MDTDESYDGPLATVLYDLAERSYVRVLTEVGRLWTLHSRDLLDEEADSLDALPLWRGLCVSIKTHMEQCEGLQALQDELDGLANAWWPIDWKAHENALLATHEELGDSPDVIERSLRRLRHRAGQTTLVQFSPSGEPSQD